MRLAQSLRCIRRIAAPIATADNRPLYNCIKKHMKGSRSGTSLTLAANRKFALNMAISIIQPSSIVQPPLNSSNNMLSFSPPTLPDVWACDNWYSHPEAIKLDDCLAALDMLPEGSQPDPWFLDPYRGEWWVSGKYSSLTLNSSTS